MIGVFEDIFESFLCLYPLIFLALFLTLISCLFKILNFDYYRFGFFNRKNCRRRKAYWRLMKYKRECRRNAKHNVLFRKENSYLLDFMRKD